MAGFDVRWTEIFLIFCSVLDNVDIIANNSVSGEESRGHRTFKIIKYRQSYYLALSLMHVVVCEFGCALKMSRKN